MTLYQIDEDTQIDEFGVDQSIFSLRDKLEYNFMRAKEKERRKSSPWYRRTYDKVYDEAKKLHDEPLYDKYKH